jgi:hypothetical protein
VTGPHLEQDDRGETERRGGLHQRGQRHEHGAQHRPAGDQADAEEAQHDGVVVGARDQVEQHERVEAAEPEGGGRVGAAVPGQSGQRGGHQRHAEQGHEPHPEEACGYLAAGQSGQHGGETEEDRSVGGAGLLPQRGDLVGERPAELGGSVRVHVHVGVDHGALGEVAVHVPAEQRRREQQRGRPDHEDEQQGARGRRFGTADQPPEQHPGGYQQDDAEVDAHQAHGDTDIGGGQQFLDRQGTGRLASQREEGGPGQTEDLTAAEIDGESLGQHSESVSTPHGRKATGRSPGGDLRVTGV